MAKPHSDPFWTSLTKTLDDISHYAGLLFAIISALTFAQGSRITSYIFLVVAYVFVAAFITRWLARKEAQRNLALAALSVATFTWLGYNIFQDVRALQGIVVTPARSGETLILLSDFDRRGTRGIDFTTRIRDRLSDEVQKAKLKDVRIETIAVTQARVGDRTAARVIGARHNATFVLWGWYDDLDIHPDLIVVPDGAFTQGVPRLSDFSPTNVDTAFLIREGLPDEVSYVTLFVMGQLLVRADRLDDARNAFATAEDNANAAKVSAGLDALTFYRAVVLQLLDADPNLVIDAYSRAIELNPEFAAAYYDRSTAREARGDAPDQVFADYAKAVDLEPRLIPFAYFSTRDLPAPLPRQPALSKLQDGIHAYSVSDYDTAIEAFNATLANDPSYAATYYFRARVHHVRREFQLAIDNYTRFLDASATVPAPYAAYAYYARALAYRALNQRDRAAQNFDAYLQNAPASDPFRADAEFYKR